jgi:hypothetical protein
MQLLMAQKDSCDLVQVVHYLQRQRRILQLLRGKYQQVFNNRLKHAIPRNPSPWIFLERLADICLEVTAEYDADVANNAPPAPDRSYLSESLAVTLDLLNNGQIDNLEFLRMMSE